MNQNSGTGSDPQEGREPNYAPSENPPALNIPGVVLALAVIILAVHAIATLILSPESYYWLIAAFAFIPATMTLPDSDLVLPAARFWSPVTHGFLHGDWTHALVNLVWLSAFGSAVARRFGTGRFLLFMALATVCGAAAHYVFHAESLSPVIGASGAVSACMGAAARFAFLPGALRTANSETQPALSLVQSLSNRGIMTFVLIWFGLNWLFGAGFLAIPGVEAQIAWEAHMGGFLFGLLSFGLFDPTRRSDFEADWRGE